MKTKLLSAALATLTIALACSANAEMTTLTKTDGEVLQVEIKHLNASEITLRTSEGEHVSAPLEQFDAPSRAAINAWAAENPKLANVFAAWDAKPVVTRSRNAVTPPQLNAPGFRGLVSLNVVLDEKGRVTWAEVSKTTHAALNDAALDAIQGWVFKPAEIGGNNVKARISISFKFES